MSKILRNFIIFIIKVNISILKAFIIDYRFIYINVKNVFDFVLIIRINIKFEII